MRFFSFFNNEKMEILICECRKRMKTFNVSRFVCIHQNKNYVSAELHKSVDK